MKQNRKLTKVLLMVYLLALTWIILFKLQMDFSNLRDMNYRSVNLIPFAGSGIVNDRVDVSEILLNVAAFVPFGIYVSMLKPDGGFWKKVLPIFCVSLFYEVMQYVLAIGGSAPAGKGAGCSRGFLHRGPAPRPQTLPLLP